MTVQTTEGTERPMRHPDTIAAGRMGVLAFGLAGVPLAGPVRAQERSAAVATEARAASDDP